MPVTERLLIAVLQVAWEYCRLGSCHGSGWGIYCPVRGGPLRARPRGLGGRTVRWYGSARKRIRGRFIGVRRLFVIAVTTMVAAAMLPVVASADPAPPTIFSAESKFDDLGVLQIHVVAPAGVNGLTAHIVSFDTGAELAVVNSFSLVSGTLQDGTFSTIDPIQLTQLGIYRVDVEAVDTLGQITKLQFAGVLTYLIQPSFSALFFNRTTITFSQRTIKVEGTLSGKWPADRQLRPIGDQPVQLLTLRGDAGVEVTTGADGRFTGLLTLNAPDDV